MAKKVISVLLAAVFVFAVFPANVFATAQNPVTDIDISNLSASNLNEYSFRLDWTSFNSPANTTATPPSPTAHAASGYDIEARNATRGTVFTVSRDDDNSPPAPYTPIKTQTVPATRLDSGSIYEFKSIPFHRHEVPIMENGVLTGYNYPKISAASAASAKALYLTDIRVDAVSSRGAAPGITVTWDYPTYKNAAGTAEAIRAYYIYYAINNGDPATADWSSSRRVKVEAIDTDPSVPDAQTVAGANGVQRLRYTLADAANFQPGTYIVGVVPEFESSRGIDVLPSQMRTLDKAKIFDGSNITFSGRPYAYNDDGDLSTVEIGPEIYVTALPDKKVRVSWTLPNFSGYDVDYYEVKRYRSGTNSTDTDDRKQPDKWVIIGTFGGLSGITSMLDTEPEGLTDYIVTIYYKHKVTAAPLEVPSEVATYSPRPFDYFPYIPTIYELKPELLNTDTAEIEMTWLAFSHEPYSAEEASDASRSPEPFQGVYIDNTITYEIWITDDERELNNNNARVETELAYVDYGDAFAYPDPAYPNNLRAAYRWTATEYYDSKTGEFKLIEPGKVYYFKIVGNKRFDITNTRSSEPGYNYVSIPPGRDISKTPVMISSPPLRVSGVTENSIGIEWETKWIEVYYEEPNPANKNREKRWYSVIGERKEGEPLVYGDPMVKLNILDPSLPENIALGLTRALINAAANDANPAAKRDAMEAIDRYLKEKRGVDLPFRIMDLKDASYKLFVAEYEEIDEMIRSGGIQDYEAYINNMLLDGNQSEEKEENSKWNTVWGEKITPTGDGNTYSYTVSDRKPNTAYVIFLRPFKDTPDGNAAYYPAFVSATTSDARGPMPLIPTAPIIKTAGRTDMSVTVKFTYNRGIEYTLYYSELLSDYPDNGRVIPWTVISEYIRRNPNTALPPPEENPDTGRMQQYLYYTVENLFPQTLYHFWVSAQAEDTPDLLPEEREVKFSNPVSETTDELAPPKPPRAFGPASAGSLDVYNKANAGQAGGNAAPASPAVTNPIGVDYMIFEWMRDVLDVRGDFPASFTSGTAEALLNELLTSTYMARFNQLIPNVRYYARAKTVLTVARGGGDEGGIVRSYSYTVQISPDEKFTDFAEITIPPLEGEPLPGALIRKESVWTNVIILRTGAAEGYDVNEKHYPLPTTDYEILYDAATKTLTYRFRSNEKDAMGFNDNQTDQRFLSRLYASGAFVFDIDLTLNGTNEVRTREIVMPYSVYRGLNERKMSLNVTAGNVEVMLKPGTFNTGEINALPDFGETSKIKLSISEYAGVPLLGSADSYASVPHKLSLSVITPTRTVNMTNTGSDMGISLKLDHRYSVMDQNVASYVSDANTGGWVRLDGKYNEVSGKVSLVSRKLSNFAAIAKKAPVLINADPVTVNSVINVSSRIDISDMPVIDPKQTVHPNQFNLLVLAVSKNTLTSVNINAPMTEADISSLGKAGILVSGSAVPREAGIHALMRLYENKTKPVRAYPKVNESSFADIKSVQQKYQASVLKAEETGMLDLFGTVLSPKAEMTFADVFYILDIIIAEAGM